METIFDLSFEIQALLVCGYFGYSIASIGRRMSHSTEDKLFQIISFGFLSLVTYKFLDWLFHLFSSPLGDIHNETLFYVVQASSMLVISVLIASLWKTKIRKWVEKNLRKLGISNEDHYPNVIGSILHGHSEMTWDYIHLHLKDGRTITSDMIKIFDLNPIGRIPLIDAEGNIGLYVTAIHTAEDKTTEFNPQRENGSFKLSYYPKEVIEGIEITWRKSTL